MTQLYVHCGLAPAQGTQGPPTSHAIHADGLTDALPKGAQAMAFLPAHLLQHLEAQVLVCQLLLGKLQVLGLLKRKRQGWVDQSAPARTGSANALLTPDGWDGEPHSPPASL